MAEYCPADSHVAALEDFGPSRNSHKLSNDDADSSLSTGLALDHLDICVVQAQHFALTY